MLKPSSAHTCACPREINEVEAALKEAEEAEEKKAEAEENE